MKKFLVAIFLLLHLHSFAQLYMFRNFKNAYESGTRSIDGMPGKNYYQNQGDYVINVSFNPKTLLISGEETITYFNNSPDSLDKIIFHLYPDYYKHGMFRNYPVDEKDENEGVTIEELEITGHHIGSKGAAGDESDKLSQVVDNSQMLDGTNLIVPLGDPLSPHSKTTVHVKWHYTLDSGSQNRTGRIDSTSSFVAYFFPRIAVYDDIDGWDDFPTRGIQEFYNDFGNFDVSISVPKGFVVWATGDLQNDSEVFPKKILDRFHAAQSSNKVTHIIDSFDYKNGLVTTANANNTWKFKANNVTDFVFSTSNHYLWDACSIVADKNTGRRVLVETAYNKKDTDYFAVIGIATRCVDIMNDTFPAVPFPFSHITVVDGTDQMEYPMMVNDNPTETREDAVQLVSHEIIHSYFPFYMGINETKYAWMDEGWATIGESVISPYLGAPEAEGVYRRGKFERAAGTDNDVPMITNSELQADNDYYNNSYGKPGNCYWQLRDMLGDEKFFKALHAFMDAWHGKHPTPYDFFYTFNNASGENLDWFWKPWFFDWSYPDLAVSIDKGKLLEVTVLNKGGMPLPIDLTLTLEDGTIIHRHETAAIWKDGSTYHILKFERISSPLVSVKLGDIYTPDSERKDNEWRK